jgi:hypothetical protein
VYRVAWSRPEAHALERSESVETLRHRLFGLCTALVEQFPLSLLGRPMTR